MMSARFISRSSFSLYIMLWAVACEMSVGAFAQDQPDIVWSRDGHSGTCPIAFSPDGSTLAVASSEYLSESGTSAYKIRFWQVADGKLLKTLVTKASLSSLSYSPNGELLVAGGFDDHVHLWRLSDEQELWNLPKGDVVCAAYSSKAIIATWVSDEQKIQLWHGPKFALRRELNGLHWSYNGVAFSPDGKFIAAAGRDPAFCIGLWKVSNGALGRTLPGHSNQIRCLAFSPDGKLLVSGGDDSSLKIWDVSGGALIRTLTGHSQMVWVVAFSLDGTIASSSSDKTIKLWRASDGTLLRSYQGEMAYHLAFSPDGKYLAYARGGILTFVRNWK